MWSETEGHSSINPVRSPLPALMESLLLKGHVANLQSATLHTLLPIHTKGLVFVPLVKPISIFLIE